MTDDIPDTLHLNCTQCGAGLDVLGGGRVKSHVCSYCGAELDAQDDYKVIRQFRDMRRPGTPFKLGMTGKLWGVDFTIIGTMAWHEYYQGKSWHWVDHQIYSPTHGYAWLTVENGFVTYARKARDIPTPATLSEMVIESSEHRPSVRFQRDTFRYYGSGRASPTFIEGEFNFRPDMDDTIRYVSLMSGNRMLDIVESRQEREYEISLLPDQDELFGSFGISAKDRPRPRGIHPLDTLDRTPLQLFVRNLAIVGTVIALVLGFVLSFNGSVIAHSESINVNQELTLPFTVTTGTGLTEVMITANARNSWAWFEAELVDANDEAVALFERGIEYYSGRDWSEGSQSARTRVLLEPGEYTLHIAMVEAEADWPGGAKAQVMRATIRQGVANAWWMWGAAGLLGLVTFYFLGGRALRHSRRWAGSDWSDD